jgi:glycosyltransferase involved in cell wall biosynthesis
MRKFEFIPFGIDTDFWRPSDDSSKHDDPFVLFVGNDLNRDYDLLVKIVENCPDKQFKFVTSRLTQEQCTENVTLIKGSAKKYSLSDNELRRLYHQSSMVIIPLKETLQPSGQSVALQACCHYKNEWSMGSTCIESQKELDLGKEG